jgi:hypothetical protein
MNEDLYIKNQIEKSIRELSFSFESIFNESGQASRIMQFLKTIIASPRMIDDLAELYRIKPESVVSKLIEIGLLPAGRSNLKKSAKASDAYKEYTAKLPQGISLNIRIPSSDLDDDGFQMSAITLNKEWADAVQLISGPDTFLSYYRSNIYSYIHYFRAELLPIINNFVGKHFPNGFDYLVTVGIGANEQFWHYPRAWYANENLSPAWFVCDNPKDIVKLPADATADNTLFLEFSRSGKTQETVKFHEFLTDDAKVIVFANTGPLKQIAEKYSDSNLSLPFPDGIPGRYGKNLTPLIVAPFEILHLPVDDYWETIAECISQWDITDELSPPSAIARFIRQMQLARGVNHVYLGCNDEILRESCAEFVQFWNEGVNRSKNDILISHYLGLPRDSHFNIEGFLGNETNKMGIFLLRRNGDEKFQHQLRRSQVQPLNIKHQSLTIADVDYALARANADHFSKRMPTILIELEKPNLMHSAVLSQLWADLTYCYACLVRLNPGSNPEVRLVRDRSDELLEKFVR